MENKIIGILNEVLETKTISLESSKEEFDNWDSMAVLNMIAEIEMAFDIQIEPEEIESFDSVKGIIKLVREKTA